MFCSSLRGAAFVALFTALAGCAAGGDLSESDGSDKDDAPLAATINIGFNSATNPAGVVQFGYYHAFFNHSVQPGPHICRTYASWDVGSQPVAAPDANAGEGTRAGFAGWLQAAGTVDPKMGHPRCDEVLVSFKGYSGGPPEQNAYKQAMDAFFSADWKGQTGYQGTFAFTPWNEPNNGAGSGDGFSDPIDASQAAVYYLTLAKECQSRGCKVAAGDLASNGTNGQRDFQWNCANDNVANMYTVKIVNGQQQYWCRTPSSRNPGNHLQASYLDRLKNHIALGAAGYGVPSHAAYFAFHGWHDVNGFIKQGITSCDYDSCITDQLLQSLGGEWGGTEIWDTEVGASQNDPIDDTEQAKAAAFLLQISNDPRITRIYYTRLYDGHPDQGELVYGSPDAPGWRPALTILANRETTYSAPPSITSAFQGANGDLWTVGSAGATDWGLGMMAGTSPSLAPLAKGGYEIAFQSNVGELWTVGSGGNVNWHLGMMAGTSPSITGIGGGYEVAFQANTTSLWTAGSVETKDWGLGMLPGTSPSITGLWTGGYEVAFQANTSSLWTVGNQLDKDWGLGMMAGTSPAITALFGGGFKVAFQANTGNLWTAGSDGNAADWGLGMMAHTSPSITPIFSNGGYEIAFQANTSALWLAGTLGASASTGLGMAQATSPSIRLLPSNQYEVSFQANTGMIWTVGQAGNYNWPLGMGAATSPSM